jgi:lipopolysaccharide export system protein LptA
MLTLISGVIFLYVSDSYKHSSQDKKNHFSFRKKKDSTIRGFLFSGYHEGRKTITIKAAKFSVEKKKISIFKFSPMRAARFRGAEIDFYVKNDPSAAGSQDKKDVTIKGLFSKKTIPSSLLKGVTSVIFEPVKINFCLDDTRVTEIRAKRASFEPLQRRIVLDGKIYATAALNQLSTDRLMIYPEKGIIKVNNKFVLKTQTEQISGEKLTTDLFLKKMDEK